MNLALILDRMAFAALQGTIALGVVSLVLLIFRNLRPDAKAWLWRLALVRFLVALFFEWRTPVLPALPSPVSASASRETVVLLASPVAPVSPRAGGFGLDLSGFDLTAVAWLAAWAIPALALMAIGVGRYWRLRRIAERAVPVAPDVRASDAVPSPCLIGLWRGLILLPDSLLAPQRAAERSLAEAHERAHRERRDPLYGLLNFTVACLFWFVLPVWLALREYSVQVEMDCDRRALRSTRLSPRLYGGMLVAYATGTTAFPGAHSMGGTGATLRRRLIAMKNAHYTSPIATLALTGLMGALLVVPIRPVRAQSVPDREVRAAQAQLQEAQKQINQLQRTLPKTVGLTAAQQNQLRRDLATAQAQIDQARRQLRLRTPGVARTTRVVVQPVTLRDGREVRVVREIEVTRSNSLPRVVEVRAMDPALSAPKPPRAAQPPAVPARGAEELPVTVPSLPESADPSVLAELPAIAAGPETIVLPPSLAELPAPAALPVELKEVPGRPLAIRLQELNTKVTTVDGKTFSIRTLPSPASVAGTRNTLTVTGTALRSTSGGRTITLVRNGKKTVITLPSGRSSITVDGVTVRITRPSGPNSEPQIEVQVKK